VANNTLLASDNFASGSLAAGWAAAFGGAKCNVAGSNPYYTEPNGVSSTSGQIWTALTWPNDHASEITIGPTFTQEANTFIDMMVRIQAAGTASWNGYYAALSNGTINIYKVVNGTPGSALKTASATMAAGDLWVFQAAGSCLSLYQNGKRIAYTYDATYTGGYPGYAQYSATAVAHSTVSSWRGYSCVQQDGIWAKQGITISAPSGNLPAGVFGMTPPIRGAAQILSGTVYKCWFSGGPLSASGGTYYAESTDALNWTAHSGQVLAGYLGPGIIQNGNTFYMYAQAGGQFGTGDFIVFTSTDGITWGAGHDTGIGLGAGSTWDSKTIYAFLPVAIINGTWYALYGGTNDISVEPSYIGKTGLATSTDGLNWTKYASNPIANGWPQQCIINVSGMWYLWVLQAQLGQGNSLHQGDSPAEGVRLKAPSLTGPWTVDCHSIRHAQMFEAVNATTGQLFPSGVIDVGGRAYMYAGAQPNDAASPQIYQMEVMIGPTTIEQIITKPENALQQKAADPFTRGAGGLGSNWTTPTGLTALQIASSGVVEASVINTSCFEIYTATAFTDNQYSEITVGALSASTAFVFPIVRQSATANTRYGVNVVGPTGTIQTTAVAIYRTVTGTPVQVGTSSAGFTVGVNDRLRLEVINGSHGYPILSFYQNDFLILSVEDISSSAILSGGYPGFGQNAATLANSQVTNWTGGNAAVIPSYTPVTGSGIIKAQIGTPFTTQIHAKERADFVSQRIRTEIR
jgi:hypothetical protein